MARAGEVRTVLESIGKGVTGTCGSQLVGSWGLGRVQADSRCPHGAYGHPRSGRPGDDTRTCLSVQ
jgi:hypothetical protein